MDLMLKNMKVLITGGNRGIGLACVKAFSKEGAQVSLLVRDTKDAKKKVSKIKSKKIFINKINFDSEDNIKQAINKSFKTMKGLDIVVNSAGGAARGGFDKNSLDEWEGRFKIKPLGLIHLCSHSVKYLKKSKNPSIINISGLHGKEPNYWTTMASTINAAVHGYSKALSTELGKFGIRVNVVSPGFSKGRRFEELVKIMAKEKNNSITIARKNLISLIPLGKLIDTEDVANAILFLASPKSRMITGSEIKVDGGRSKHI